MFIRKSKYLVEKLIAEQRISYLENIICPTQSHNYKDVGFNIIDGNGTTIHTYQCEKCGKIKKDF